MRENPVQKDSESGQFLSSVLPEGNIEKKYYATINKIHKMFSLLLISRQTNIKVFLPGTILLVVPWHLVYI